MARGSASPFVIVLTAEEHRELESRVRAYTAPYAQVVRAKIVLLAAEGMANVEIAARLDTSPQVVHRWRKRFWERRLKGLEDAAQKRKAPGLFPLWCWPRSRHWPASCRPRPACRCSRWTCAELAHEVVSRGVVNAHLGRHDLAHLDRADAIKPWLHRSWIYPRNQHFATKAARVLDLYARIFDGQPLTEDVSS